MSRTGVEEKPTWSTVPTGVRAGVANLLGSPVQRAMRVWGGYGDTPTFRLRLQDGRRAFFKGVNPASNEFMRLAFAREERNYRELGQLLSRWAPAFYGAFQQDNWSVMLLEDLGAKSVPPWTAGLARQMFRQYGDFHRTTVGIELPAWLPGPEEVATPDRVWSWAESEEGLRPVAQLAGERSAGALRWLLAAAPRCVEVARRNAGTAERFALLHGDTRSDNLRWVRGELKMFDWPHASVGPPETDLVPFAQAVTLEGGPEPEQLVAWYAERMPVDGEALDTCLVQLAGFFANQAWLPDIPGLPRLRPFQRAQLRVTLAWVARRLALPDPAWLDAVID